MCSAFLVPGNMVEQALADSLNPDENVRNPACQRLAEEEKASGFFPQLLHIYAQSADPKIKLQAILLLKNTINRRWNTFVYPAQTKTSAVSNEDKAATKEALVRVVFEEQSYSLALQLRLAVTHIAKYEFPEKWGELGNCLLEKIQTQISERTLELMYAVLKVQLSKRMPSHKIAMAKAASAFLPPVVALWTAHTDLILEKILMVLLCYQPQREVFALVLQRPFPPDPAAAYARRKSLCRGLRNMLAAVPELFEDSSVCCATLNLTIAAFDTQESTPPGSLLIQHSADCLSTMITTWKITEDSDLSPASQAISTFLESQELGITRIELLLKRLLDIIASEDHWKLWREQHYDQFFSEDDSEEPHIQKLVEVLFLTYPHLTFKHVPELNTNFSTFSPEFQQAVIILFGQLPHFVTELKVQPPVSLSEILQTLNQVPADGFHRLVLLKGAAWLIRKWLDLAPQDQNLLPLLKQIKDNSKDIVVVYECCLTLKQMLYKGFSVPESTFILSDFAAEIMNLLSAVSTPQVIWHLIMLISALLEKTAYERNDSFLAALSESAVPTLLTTSSEMIVCALCDMFEHLLYSSSDVPFIIELVSQFIMKQLPSGNENVEMIWHFTVSNVDTSDHSINTVNQLLPGLPYVSSKGVYFKIIEEYLMLYQTAGKPMGEFLTYIMSQVLSTYLQTESNFDEASVMSLLETVGLIDVDYLLPVKNTIVQLLIGAKNDVYDSIWVSKAVVLLDKLVLKDVAHCRDLPLDAWLRSMETLKNPNHRKINCAALLVMFPFLPTDLLTGNAEAICKLTLPYIENYAHSLDHQTEDEPGITSITRTKYTQVAPSTRKISSQRSDKFLTINLLSLFKEQVKLIKSKGIALEMWIGNAEIRNQYVQLQSTSLHGRSSSS